MNENNIKEALDKVATVVLEDWAMAFVGETPEGFTASETTIPVEASVMFSGNIGVSGQLFVMADHALAETVCRSVLGMDGDEELDIISKIDALKELVNVLGGHFLTEAFGKTPVFQLSAPECRDVEIAEVDSLSSKYTNWYSPDDHVIGIRVQFNQE